HLVRTGRGRHALHPGVLVPGPVAPGPGRRCGGLGSAHPGQSCRAEGYAASGGRLAGKQLANLTVDLASRGIGSACEDLSMVETSNAGAAPYDALLLLSFGGPEGPEEVVPF